MDQEKIYLIAVLESKKPWLAGGIRTWGWYRRFEDAEAVVLENQTDIFECTYDYACIEEMPEGVLADGRVVQWYRAHYDIGANDPVVTKCEPPDFVEGIANFTIG